MKFNLKAEEGLICNEEDHSGSDYTSRSVARNQVPGRHKLDSLVRSLSVAITNTDLKPFNNNLQWNREYFRLRFWGVVNYKGIRKGF